MTTLLFCIYRFPLAFILLSTHHFISTNHSPLVSHCLNFSYCTASLHTTSLNHIVLLLSLSLVSCLLTKFRRKWKLLSSTVILCKSNFLRGKDLVPPRDVLALLRVWLLYEDHTLDRNCPGRKVKSAHQDENISYPLHHSYDNC